MGQQLGKIKRLSVSTRKLIHGEEHLGVKVGERNNYHSSSFHQAFDSPRQELDRGMKAAIRYLRNLGQKRRVGVVSPVIKESNLKLKLPFDKEVGY